MKFVLADDISIRFDPSGVSRPTRTLRCDPKPLSGVLVNPFHIKPLPGVGIVWCNEMKFLRVETLWVAKWDYVSGNIKLNGLICSEKGLPSFRVSKLFIKPGLLTTSGNSFGRAV